jgi:hypothetical protein
VADVKSGHSVHSHILYNIVEISTIPETPYFAGFSRLQIAQQVRGIYRPAMKAFAKV